MHHLGMKVILALGSPPQPGQQQPPIWTSLVPMLLLVAVFYFAMIRPQQKKAKDHAELLKNVRPGDRVVTSGGILGVVITVKDKSLTLRSADAKMEINKSAISEILERAGQPEES